MPVSAARYQDVTEKTASGKRKPADLQPETLIDVFFHKLSQPLGALYGTIEVALMSDDPKEHKAALETGLDHIERLLWLFQVTRTFFGTDFRARGQRTSLCECLKAAMENCLQKAPDINIVYTINEPAAAGAYRALKTAGKEKDVLIVSIDGGCEGVRHVKAGEIAATAQQYPLKMASMGVVAGVEYAKTAKKVSGYTDTGVTLISDKPMAGVDSKDTKFGLQNCWGK